MPRDRGRYRDGCRQVFRLGCDHRRRVWDTPAKSGLLRYSCTFHPSMSGTLDMR